mmetsp:Transcript_11015/g.27849  ORF Transcript_11015/g.27849 Transcript_11015/m.27849 type:complete len:508 (+) Transcript_11015:925-2448(+)
MEGLPLVVVVKVRRAGNSRCEGRLHARVPLDEAPHVVPVLAVPLGPNVPVGEGADLVEAAAVPRLADELDLGQGWILGDRPDQGRVLQRLPSRVPAQCAGEVKAKAVHVVLLHPVPQAVQDQRGHDRVVGVHRVAASRVVEHLVVALRILHVVHRAVDAPKAQHVRVGVPALGGVVIHDVQDHLDAAVVQILHQPLELDRRLRRAGAAGPEPRHRGEEVHVRIPPHVDHVVAGVGAPLKLHLVVLEDGQQLDARDTELLEVRNLPPHALEGAPHVLGQAARRVCGEEPHAHLVNHRILERSLGPRVVLAPVERVQVLAVEVEGPPEGRPAALNEALRLIPLAENAPPVHERRIRVHHNLPLVPAVQGLPAPLTRHAHAVQQLVVALVGRVRVPKARREGPSLRHVVQEHVEHAAGAAPVPAEARLLAPRHLKLPHDVRVALEGDAELHGGRVLRDHGEVHARCPPVRLDLRRGTQRVRVALRGLEHAQRGHPFRLVPLLARGRLVRR